MSDEKPWTDEEFLSYVDIHSRTERALFSGEMLIRLRDLSGMFLTAMGGIDPSKFYPLHDEDALPLVRRARENLMKAKDAKNAYPVAAERAAIRSLPASGPALAVLDATVQDAVAAWRDLVPEARELLFAGMMADGELSGVSWSTIKRAVAVLRAFEPGPIR